MKHTLLGFFIASLVSLNTSAQQYKTFKLNTEKPETGKEIRFVYTGIFSRKLDPRITLYFDKGGRTTWITLKAKYTGSRTEGSFILPDSILAFCVKPRNHRDTAEAFIFHVYQKGKLIKGSLAAAAQMYAGNMGLTGLNDTQKSMALYRSEFAQHPEIRPHYLLSYFASAAFGNDETIIRELESTWQDSLQYGKSEQFMNQLYQVALRYQKLTFKERLKTELIAKYPKGTLAFYETEGDVPGKIRKGDFANELNRLEKKYQLLFESGELDRIYLQYGRELVNKGLISSVDTCLEKIRNKVIQKDLYLFAATALSKSDFGLKKAEVYIQQALALLGYEKTNLPYYVSDQIGWNKTLEGYRGNYLDIYAQIQHKLGNTGAALENLKTALSINDYNDQIKVHYLQYLIAEKQYKSALETASGYISNDQETEDIRKLLFESYAKEHASAAGDEAYYQSLISLRDQQYKVPEYSKLNLKSINFTLNDLEGDQFSLAEHKGKSVILYFFNSKYTNPDQNARNGYFNQKAAEYKSNKNIVFVGIDRTPAFDSDETTREEMRLESLKSYLKHNNLNFRVLLDNYIYDPKNSGNTYFRVADEYSSDSSCQFYMIDRKGMVRYKSYIIPGGFNRFMRDFSGALKLIH